MDLQREKIRILVNGIYDIQKLRIATGNRIVQSFNIQMGQTPSTRQEEMDVEASSLINTLRSEYKRITDAYVSKEYYLDKGSSSIVTKKVEPKDGADSSEIITISLKKNAKIIDIIKSMNERTDTLVIKNEYDYNLMKHYMELFDSEEGMLKDLEKEVTKHPMWDAFFKDVKGCGVLMAAVCLTYLDVNKARHASSFWKYAGLDTVDVVKEDGTIVNEGRTSKKAHNVEQVYVDKDGNEQSKMGLGYNPNLKTKLIGVLAPCLLKAGLRVVKGNDKKPVLDEAGNKQYVASSKYTECYLDYRNRLDQRKDTKEYSSLHKYNMSVRYMIKQFLRDMWVTWRTLEGYTVSEPYEVAKLGNMPHKYNEYHERVATEGKRTA